MQLTAEDIGAELCALGYHLYRSAASPQDAFRELTLRTHVERTDEDTVVATGVEYLPRTLWYKQMCSRYTAMRSDVRHCHESDVVEAVDLVKSLYPNGCSVSEFADAVQTCTDMMVCAVPSTHVTEYISAESDSILRSGLHEISTEDLSSGIVERLLLPSWIQDRWWVTVDSGVDRSACAKPTRVGLRASPPMLAIEYERPPGHLRHRRIKLEGLLREEGPTGPLARRLSATHDVLLTETDFQRLLMKLQRIMSTVATDRNATASEPVAPQGASTQPPPAAATLPPAGPSQDAVEDKRRGGDGGPQKADLGLLFRDPERALDNVDLNDADEVTLKEFKDVMNEKFVLNAVKPGDAGYVYDKRLVVEKPSQKSEWDDSDDD